MITSRLVGDLHPKMREAARQHKARCGARGIDLLIYCTFRDNEAQDALFAQGRTKPGKIVTNARGGESLHNFRLAYDCVPIILGKADWASPRWKEIGEIGEAVGLVWAGRWKGSLRETAHFQAWESLRDEVMGPRD